MSRLIPRIEAGRWGGGGIGRDIDVDGFFIAIAWLGLHVEICLARETRS